MKRAVLISDCCIVMSLAPSADVEKKEETVAPPAVVSSYISSQTPVTRIVPPVNPPAPKPTADRTEEEDNDYDSDDASKTKIIPLKPNL